MAAVYMEKPLKLPDHCAEPAVFNKTGEKRAKRNEKAISESAQQQMSHEETILVRVRMARRANVASL